LKRSDQRRLAVFALYQNDLTGRELDDLFEKDTPEFTRELAEQTLADRERLDTVIVEHTTGSWPITRIAPLERNIMRVAINELYNRDDVPREVAVDEAIELAKRYCSADAPKFVNGILGAVLRGMPALVQNPEPQGPDEEGADGES
jgi:N utilization substance protein B